MAPTTGDTGMSAKPEARWAATPGRFCEAMVTTNSGKARLTSAPRLKTGVVQTGSAQPQCTPAKCSRPCSAATATPASSTPGTA